MSLYSDIIKKRYENDSELVKRAEDSLYNNNLFSTHEKKDFFQMSIDYVLSKYGIDSAWIHGIKDTEDLLEAKLNPYGLMYKKIDVSDHESILRHGGYIIAFGDEGDVYVLSPAIIGYNCLSIANGKKKHLTKTLKLKPDGYGILMPMKGDRFSLGSYASLVLRFLSLRDVLPIAMTMLLVTLLGAVAPRVNKYVLSTVVDTGNMNMLFKAMILFLSAGILKVILTTVKSVLLNQMKTRVSLQAQSTVVARVLLLPQRILKEISSGKLSKQISQSRRLAGLIIGMLVDTSLTVLFSLVYIGQMAAFSPILVIPAVVMLLVKILASFLIAKENSENEKNDMEVSMENSRFLFMSIQGIQKIKGLGAEKRIYAHWAGIYQKMLVYRLDQPFLVKMEKVIMSFITAFTTVLLLAIAAPNGVTGADYMAFNAAYALIIIATEEVLNVVRSIYVMRALAKNVEPLFAHQTEGSQNDELVRNLQGRVCLENVSFSYPDSSIKCLDNISLSVKKGEKIAIVGQSGCGKTTLINLLLGVESPDSGMIMFDDRPVNSLDKRSLRRNIGTVLQYSSLLPGTIFSNIAFNRTDLTEEEAWEAAEKASIADYIRTLPLGMYTEVVESQSNGFSGGQRQRIHLARVFASKTNIKILDEPTSALDNVTQKKVLEAIYCEPSTVIMVAHRLSTVKDCDRILVIEEGRISESGTYDELIKKNGSFAALVKKQMSVNGEDSH